MVWHLVELFLYAAAVGGMFFTHKRTQQRLEQQALQRASVLQKQAKAVARVRRQAVEEFNRSNAEARHLFENTRLMHERADALLRDVRAAERTWAPR